MDTRGRSWTKSISWRIIGVVILGGISYAITKDWGATTGITLIFHSLRFVLYYAHERAWERVQWGTVRHPLSHLPVTNNLSGEDQQIIREFLCARGYIVEPPEYEI